MQFIRGLNGLRRKMSSAARKFFQLPRHIEIPGLKAKIEIPPAAKIYVENVVNERMIPQVNKRLSACGKWYKELSRPKKIGIAGCLLSTTGALAYVVYSYRQKQEQMKRVLARREDQVEVSLCITPNNVSYFYTTELCRQFLVCMNDVKRNPGVSFVAISGIPGSGKSELAKWYADQHEKRVRKKVALPIIFTIDASTEESLKLSFAALYNTLKIVKLEGESEEAWRKRANVLLHEVLKRRPDALLIFDNATNRDWIRPYIEFPRDVKVTVLVTTQMPNYFNDVPGCKNFSMTDMSSQEAKLFLQNLSGISDENGLGELVSRIDRVPLELSTIALFIKQKRNTTPDFNFSNLIKILEADGDIDGASKMVRRKEVDYKFTQKEVLFKMIAELPQNSQKILRFCSVLCNNDIPQALLNSFIESAIGPNLNIYDFIDSMNGLLHATRELRGERFFSIHKSSQAVLQAQLDKNNTSSSGAPDSAVSLCHDISEELLSFVNAVSLALNKLSSRHDSIECQELLPHIHCMTQSMNQRGVCTILLAGVMVTAGDICTRFMCFEDADRFLKDAECLCQILILRDKKSKEVRLLHANAHHFIGRLMLESAQDLAMAEKFLRRSLQEIESIGAKGSNEWMETANHLGTLLIDTNEPSKLTEAITLFNSLLKQSNDWSRDLYNQGKCLFHISNATYSLRGRKSDAETSKRCLSILDKIISADGDGRAIHYGMSYVYNLAGRIHFDMANFDLAEQCLEKALGIMLDPSNHGRIELTSVMGISYFYLAQISFRRGDLDAANTFSKKSIERLERLKRCDAQVSLLRDLLKHAEGIQKFLQYLNFARNHFECPFTGAQWENAELSLAKPIQAGASNVNFKIMVEDNAYVIRFPNNALVGGVSRADEKRNSTIAHKIGVGPKVIYFDSDGLMVTAFIPNKGEMTVERLKNPFFLRAAVLSLRTLHQSQQPFLNTIYVEHEISKAYDFICTQDSKASARFQALKPGVDAALLAVKKDATLVPCHNDPSLSNFIVAYDDAVKMVDWEYSGSNNPVWDLASLSIRGNFSEEQDEDMLKLYYGIVNSDIKAMLLHYKQINTFVLALWGKVHALKASSFGDNERAKYYRDYSEGRLALCEELCGDPPHRSTAQGKPS